MMKKTLWAGICLSALSLLVSCQEEVHLSQELEVAVHLHFPASTKGSGLSDDASWNVNSLQVFVFDGERLEGHARVTDGSGALTVHATAGTRTLWAVANDPRDLYATLHESEASPLTLSKLRASRHYLKDNAAQNLIMSGSITRDLQENGSLSIEVKRAVCRIELHTISCALGTFRQGWSIELKSLTLINVPGDNDYAYGNLPLSWVNPLGHRDPDFDRLLHDPLEGTVVQDSAYTVPHVYYAYPHSFPQCTEAAWSPRGSLLVLEATVWESDGHTAHHGYYPIPLPELKPNRVYSIQEVRIRHLPSPYPYLPLDISEGPASVTIEEWEMGLDMGRISI